MTYIKLYIAICTCINSHEGHCFYVVHRTSEEDSEEDINNPGELYSVLFTIITLYVCAEGNSNQWFVCLSRVTSGTYDTLMLEITWS